MSTEESVPDFGSYFVGLGLFILCHTGEINFISWKQIYIYIYEEALQKLFQSKEKDCTMQMNFMLAI